MPWSAHSSGENTHSDKLSELLTSALEVGLGPRPSDDKALTYVTLFLVGVTSPLPKAPACSLKKEVIQWFPQGGFPHEGEGDRWGGQALSSEGRNVGKAGSCPGWPPRGKKWDI